MPIPDRWSPHLLSVFRFVFGMLFLSHGVSKFFGLPPFPMPLNPLLTVAGVLELVGGALIAIGLATRPVGFLLSGLVHASKGPIPIANGGEAAILYCFGFLYLAAAGGGRWSVDALRWRA
jgi:putative oxidoreductase